MKTFLTKFVFLFAFFIGALGQAQAQLPGFNQAVAGDDSIGLAAGDQVSPYIASNGSGVQLVVWADERSNPYAFYEYETSSDIYAMRLDSNGQKVEDVPFIISAQRGAQTRPKAAWNGTHWLVVFESTTLSGTGYYYSSLLVAVRVAADGSVIDDQPTPIYGLNTGQWALASDGDQWVVVSEGSRVSNDIFAVRIAADGTLLDPPTRTLVEETYYGRTGIRLAHADGLFLLTFNDRSGTAALRFNSDLSLVDPVPYVLLARSIGALGSNGTGFYIAWDHQREDFSRVIRGSRVDPATGAMLDGAGIDLSGSFPLDASGGGIGVAWDGANWRVSWPNGGTRVARVSAAGTVLDPGGSLLPGVTAGVTAGTGAQGVQFAWSDFDNNEYDVFAAAVDINDDVLTVDGLSIGSPRQYRGDLAAGADGYMAVYRSAHADQVRILAQPLDSAGNSLGAEPIQLDVGTILSGPGSPAVAWNGSLYMVSWSSPDGVVAKRILQDGTVLDAVALQVMSPAHGAVDLAALGEDFLVVAMRFSTSVHFSLPIATRIGGDGLVLDTEPSILGAYFVRTMAVTTLGGRWLVAWHRNVTHDDPLAETRGALINPDGSIESAFPIHGYFSTTGGNSIFTIGLASAGDRALMVQSQELTSGVETDLLAHLVNADGTVEPMVNLTPWPGNQYRPEVSFDGRDFILVYQDQKNRIAQGTLDQLDARSDIYGMRIQPDGTILDPQGFLVADSPLAETDPVIASRGADTLIAASQLPGDGPHAAYRVRLSEVLDGSNRFPVAVAGASVTSGDAPLTVNFNSGGSYDPEGSPLSYLWQFADGGSASTASASHEFTVPGEYPVMLTVFDALAQPSSQSITIVATAPNRLPVAVATASPLSGPVPLSVTLFADGSYDPDGHLGNIEWLHNGSLISYNATAYQTFSEEGVYDVVLRVFDSRGAIDEDTVTITATPAAGNIPPTALASATPSSGDAPLNVAFSSSGSNDPDGSIVSYLWDFGDGTSSTGANPSHLYTSVGTYNVLLTVTDNTGDSDTATTTVTVNALSAASLLTGITMSTSGKRGIMSIQAVVLVTNGEGGVERSAIVQGKWTMPDGSTTSPYEYSDRKGKATFNVTANMDGVYLFEIVTVTKSGFAWDEAGSETSDSYLLGNGGANQPPTASFMDDCNALSCVFDGAASSDADGTIVSYAWDFGDGTGGSGASTGRDYVAAGSYTVVLTVTDNEGASDSSSRVVTITDEPPPPPAIVHIGDLDGESVAALRNRWQATVTVALHDPDEMPVADATVSGAWSDGANGSGSCVTNGSGLCSVSKGNLKGNVSSVTFRVASVTAAGAVYDSTANHDSEPDSDGTVIVIVK